MMGGRQQWWGKGNNDGEEVQTYSKWSLTLKPVAIQHFSLNAGPGGKYASISIQPVIHSHLVGNNSCGDKQVCQWMSIKWEIWMETNYQRRNKGIPEVQHANRACSSSSIGKLLEKDLYFHCAPIANLIMRGMFRLISWYLHFVNNYCCTLEVSRSWQA